MRIGRVNLCQPVLTIPSETTRAKSIHIDFTCCKNGYPVRACRYFKPIKFGDGASAYEGECDHFENCLCTCGKARSAAQLRAEAILKAWMV